MPAILAQYGAWPLPEHEWLLRAALSDGAGAGATGGWASWTRDHHLDALDTAGVQTLVLKGVPLALAYHKDVAARPMTAADVRVPSPSAAAKMSPRRFHAAAVRAAHK